MFSSTVLLALVAAVAAQNTIIEVGQGGFKYTPLSVNATEGSVITFKFDGAPGNHTVTQSSFAAPCTPLQGGFDSGYISVPAGFTGDFPTWNLTVTNATAPIWFYCKAPAPSFHCGQGMVGGINVPASGAKTIEAFNTAAVAVGNNPGTQNAVGALAGVGASASAAPGPLTASGLAGFGTPGAAGAAGATGASGSAAPNGTGAASSGAPAPTTGAATLIGANTMFVVGAAIVGSLLA